MQVTPFSRQVERGAKSLFDVTLQLMEQMFIQVDADDDDDEDGDEDGVEDVEYGQVIGLLAEMRGSLDNQTKSMVHQDVSRRE